MMSRRLFFVLIVSAILSIGVLAQPRNGEGRGEAQLKKLQEKVGLTDEQTAKVKEILQKAREEGRKAFENGDGDREAMREMMMKSREKSDAEIMKLLTKEQKPKFEAFRKEQKKEMEERMRERQ
ncbi:MAG: Spy/CpxP family protein refolding chaperone [Bacteroidota bacterium]